MAHRRWPPLLLQKIKFPRSSSILMWPPVGLPLYNYTVQPMFTLSDHPPGQGPHQSADGNRKIRLSHRQRPEPFITLAHQPVNWLRGTPKKCFGYWWAPLFQVLAKRTLIGPSIAEEDSPWIQSSPEVSLTFMEINCLSISTTVIDGALLHCLPRMQLGITCNTQSDCQSITAEELGRSVAQLIYSSTTISLIIW